MTNANVEVVQMYETLDMSPEEIAENTGYDVVSIKAILLQFSPLYKGVARKTPIATTEEDHCPVISEGELNEAYEVLKELVRYSESDIVRLRAAERIIDEKKGRLNSKLKEVANEKVNVVFFNEQLLKAREAKVRLAERLGSAKLIEAPAA